MITIVVADDHKVLRQGLCALLKEQPDFHVIGDVGDGESAVQLVEQLHPDVLIVDMVMPGINGIEVTKRVREQVPSCAVIVLSMYGAEGYVREAIEVGAKAYVLKKDSVDELASAIREAIANRYFISPSITKLATDSFAGIGNHKDDPYQTLTARERQILHMVAAGNTSAQIALKLFVSRRTVEFHRVNIMQKLKLNTQQELTRYCLEMGISPHKDI